MKRLLQRTVLAVLTITILSASTPTYSFFGYVRDLFVNKDPWIAMIDNWKPLPKGTKAELSSIELKNTINIMLPSQEKTPLQYAISKNKFELALRMVNDWGADSRILSSKNQTTLELLFAELVKTGKTNVFLQKNPYFDPLFNNILAKFTVPQHNYAKKDPKKFNKKTANFYKVWLGKIFRETKDTNKTIGNLFKDYIGKPNKPLESPQELALIDEMNNIADIIDTLSDNTMHFIIKMLGNVPIFRDFDTLTYYIKLINHLTEQKK